MHNPGLPLTRSEGLSCGRIPADVQQPSCPGREFAPLGGLLTILFVAGAFWAGVYELAKWLVRL